MRDISLEVPNDPPVVGSIWRPKVDVNIHTSSRKLPESFYESILKVEITAKSNGKLAFIVEVTQCGSFLLKNLNEEEMLITLGMTCPTTLFPYARETIDNLLVKGGMPPLHLAQVNFNTAVQSRTANKQPEQTQDDANKGLKKKLVIESSPKGKLN